jgi:Family of unknown function (DUF6882)
MNPKLIATLNKHAAATFDKQLHLQELVGDLPWSYDLETGLLGFGDAYQWQTQVLGSQSDATGTWLWGWANEASGIPPSLLADVNSLRKLGAEKAISELCEPKLATDECDGHAWSILATGLCRAPAYYRGAYDGGALYVLIKDPNYPRKIDRPLLRLATVFPQAISTYEISDHKLALVGHAELLGLSFEQKGNDIVVANDRGQKLTARFDDQHRLTKLEGAVS